MYYNLHYRLQFFSTFEAEYASGRYFYTAILAFVYHWSPTLKTELAFWNIGVIYPWTKSFAFCDHNQFILFMFHRQYSIFQNRTTALRWMGQVLHTCDCGQRPLRFAPAVQSRWFQIWIIKIRYLSTKQGERHRYRCRHGYHRIQYCRWHPLQLRNRY